MNTLILYLTVCTILFIASYVPFVNILFIFAALVCSYEEAGGERMALWKRKED